MIEIGLGAVAGVLKSLAKEWTEDRVIIIDPLSALEQEPTYQKLKAEGYEMGWPKATQLRQKVREGWEPVIERDKLLRPHVFMDRLKELVLVMRKPPSNAA